MKPGKPLTFAKVPVPEQNRRGGAGGGTAARARGHAAHAVMLRVSVRACGWLAGLAHSEGLPLGWLRFLSRPPLAATLPVSAGACWSLGCPATPSAAW